MGGWAVLGHGFDTSSTRRLLQAGAVAFAHLPLHLAHARLHFGVPRLPVRLLRTRRGTAFRGVGLPLAASVAGVGQ